MIRQKTIELRTEGNGDMVDITSHIELFVKESALMDGQVTVFVQGSTGAITTIEYEPNLVRDFSDSMERLAPSDIVYHHKKTWNDDNGYSHVRASVVGCSETVPVQAGRLLLGTWQQVVVVDFDTRARKRTVILTAAG